jgi:hypothetical protein
MKRQSLIKNALGIGFVFLLLFGCNPPSAPVPTGTSVPPTATPVPPTQTSLPPTPTTKIIEATPIPSQVPSLEPAPGVTFSGPIEISGTASSGAISFIVSEDLASITSVSVTLHDIKCDGFSAGSIETSTSGPFPVTDGKIASFPFNQGEIKGQFISSTEAVGTIHLKLVFSILNQKTVCELGTWNWSIKED